jgi:hypothetical protein
MASLRYLWEVHMLHALRRGAIAAVFLCSSYTFASAAETYVASLDGAMAEPQSESSAIGVVSARFDSATRTLTWKMSYSGTTGSPTALVIHAATAGGGAGSTVIPVSAVSGRPIVGSTRLSDAEARALMAGRLYFGIRTNSHGGREIGGQAVSMGPSDTLNGATFEARRP